MNALADKFGDSLAILAFPCNQFGHMANEGTEAELLASLKHVRPGKGFEPRPGVKIFQRGQVNGKEAQPLFKWLRAELMACSDPPGADGLPVDTMNKGCSDNEVIVIARGTMDNTTCVPWAPVTRSDIAWNFEKFLVTADGKAHKRYSRFCAFDAIEKDIDELLKPSLS